MADHTNLMTLPQELQDQIVGNLEWPDTVYLKATCKHFSHLIPSLNMEQLLEAEKSVFCKHRDLYACRYCLRLRDGTEFADRMRENCRSRGDQEAAKRFCVDCGLNTPNGAVGYSFGAEISMGGVTKIICILQELEADGRRY